MYPTIINPYTNRKVNVSSKLGRSIIFKGKHLKTIKKKSLSFDEKPILTVKNVFPNWLMNRLTIKILNFFYYLLSYPKQSYVKINEFFYPH